MAARKALDFNLDAAAVYDAICGGSATLDVLHRLQNVTLLQARFPPGQSVGNAQPVEAGEGGCVPAMLNSEGIVFVCGDGKGVLVRECCTMTGERFAAKDVLTFHPKAEAAAPPAPPAAAADTGANTAVKLGADGAAKLGSGAEAAEGMASDAAGIAALLDEIDALKLENAQLRRELGDDA